MNRRAYLQVAGGFQSEVFEYRVDAGVNLFRAQVCEAEPGCEQQVLIDSKFLYKEVVLGHKADKVPDGRFCDFVSVQGYGSAVRLKCAVEQGQECGLADPAAAHHGYQLAAAQGEG